MAAGHRRVLDQGDRSLGIAENLLAEGARLHQILVRGRLGERRGREACERRTGGEKRKSGRAERAADDHASKSSNVECALSGPLASPNYGRRQAAACAQAGKRRLNFA